MTFNIRQTSRSFRILGIALLLAAGGLFWWLQGGDKSTAGRDMNRAVPVRVAPVTEETAPRFLVGLGTVQASGSVLVRSRVDGQLMHLHFSEGQHVKKGDLLAEIDPRPFQNSLREAQGQLARDKAQLDNARRDLTRYAQLSKGDYIATQQVETQRALVRQYEGVVRSDEAQVASAALQLEYSRITAPLDGKLGLRQVDEGNMIRAADTTGIVRITRSSPCEVIFTLPETNLSLILQGQKQAAAHGQKLEVQAWDRNQTHMLATGSLTSVDNQIDSATGTVKLKATFDNADENLYPNQFVNVRLRVLERDKAVVAPAAAVQLGAQGDFVYVAEDGKARLQPITIAWRTKDSAVIEKGLTPGQNVVVDGVDRLRDGTPLSLR